MHAKACLALVLLLLTAGGALAQDAPDVALVRQKIQNLGVRDDTIAWDEKPEYWLRAHLKTSWPELLPALDDPELRVVQGAVRLLDQAEPAPEIRAALLRILATRSHPLRVQAAVSLYRYRDSPTVQRTLADVLDGGLTAPKPMDQSRLAEAAGHSDEAAQALRPLIAGDGWDAAEAADRLGQLGGPAAIAVLTDCTDAQDWRAVAAAFLALAKVDPTGHALTAQQQAFLECSREPRGKMTPLSDPQLQRQLASLDTVETRRCVQAMLRTHSGWAALAIIRLRRDVVLLPRLWELLEASGYNVPYTLAQTIFTLDSSDTAVTRFIAWGRGQRDGVVTATADALRADLPDARALAILQRLGRELSPRLAPQALRFVPSRAALICPLMAAETDLAPLVAYCQAIPTEAAEPCAPEVLRALRLAATPVLTASPRRDDLNALQEVLKACARLSVAGSGAVADRFVGSMSPVLSIRAARVAAALGGDRARALATLQVHLSRGDTDERALARQAFNELPCRDPAERIAREQFLLGLWGTPATDVAALLLPQCAGERTVAALTPELDNDSVPAALAAAWVLAQGQENTARSTARRRLGLACLFCRSYGQQGNVDDVVLPCGGAVGLPQCSQECRPSRAPVLLTRAEAMPPQLSEAEQAFAVRAYHDAQHRRGHISRPWGCRWPDATYVPLLRLMAVEDDHVQALYVKGQAVAHLPERQHAAQELARLTGQPASYVGRAGEQFDSAAFPTTPHPDQARLVAAFVLDWITRLDLAALASPAGGEGRETIRGRTRTACDEFPGLRDALQEGIRARGLEATMRALDLNRL